MTTQAGGTIIWHELMSRDPDASERFYGDVVGLSVVPAGDGPEAYRMLVADGRPIGGVTGPRPGTDVWPSGGPAGHWVGYFESADVDAAAAKAQELGGDVRLGPLDIPGVGRVAVLRDPDGATFGLFDPARPGG
ncbi:MAG TPA: VOC family protein [Candidatus Limnocylindrales bacterium]|nr:VOC family protein [Candidatus Limnocylindrales bacterium]